MFVPFCPLAQQGRDSVFTSQMGENKNSMEEVQLDSLSSYSSSGRAHVYHAGNTLSRLLFRRSRTSVFLGKVTSGNSFLVYVLISLLLPVELYSEL